MMYQSYCLMLVNVTKVTMQNRNAQNNFRKIYVPVKSKNHSQPAYSSRNSIRSVRLHLPASPCTR